MSNKTQRGSKWKNTWHFKTVCKIKNGIPVLLVCIVSKQISTKTAVLCLVAQLGLTLANP